MKDQEKATTALWDMVDGLDQCLADKVDNPLLEGVLLKKKHGVSLDLVFSAALVELSSMRKRLILARRSSDLMMSAIDPREDNASLEECLRESDVLDADIKSKRDWRA
jgi:hypothetical protein